MWSIKILKGPKAGEKFTLSEGENLIGRSPQCDIYINSPGISKEHAKIVVQNGHITLVDLNSTNGTFVNGIRIQKQKLKLTDKISIFDIMMGFESNQPRAQIPSISPFPTNSSFPTDGGTALQYQSSIQPTDSIQAIEQKDYLDKAEDYLETVLLPGVYKIPESLEMKWSLGTMILVFVFIVTSLSVLPMIQLTKSGIQRESQRRALSLAKNLAERFQIASRDGMESSFSAAQFEREEGVQAAYIISSGDGVIIAPAKKAGVRPDDAFVHSARRQDQSVVEQISDSQVGAVYPIKTFDTETGALKVLAHSVILYDMGAMSIDTNRTISLFAQVFAIALLFGFILYYFIYKVFEFPLRNINTQIDNALKDGNGFAESKYQFPVLQELINNINTLINRAQNPSPQSGSLALVDSQIEAQNLVQNYPSGAIALDKNEYLLAVNEMFTDIAGMGSQNLQGLKLDQISDQAFILSVRDLIEQSKLSNGLSVFNSLEFNGRSVRISLQPLYDKMDIKYYFVTLQFQDGGGF